MSAKILIIDYEPRGIRQLNDPLEAAGYEILIAKDGLAGVQAFHDSRPDLVLIEAMLPKRHGFEVCQELKHTAHGRKTPIVIVTSVYKGRKYRSQAIHQHGCDEYLEKPIAPDKLLEVVTRLLGARPTPVRAASGPPAAAGGNSSAPVEPSAGSNRSPAESEITNRLDEIFGEPRGGGSGTSG